MKPRSELRPYKVYAPLPHQRAFHDVVPWGPKTIKLAYGGWGSAKTTMCVEEFNDLSMRFPRGQSVIVRKSMEGRGEISLVPEFRRRLDPIGVSVTDKKIDWPNGHVSWFLPGDDAERFASFPLTHAYMQEAHEIESPRVYQALSGRLRDEMGKVDGQWMLRLLIDARGFSEGHWLNKEIIEKGWNIRRPETRSSCVNPNIAWIGCKTAENAVNLPPNYESDLRLEHENDLAWQKVYLDGEIGFDVEGIGVFADSYDPEVHDVDEIVAAPDLGIWRGWDFGFRAPACVFVQYTRSGRLLVLSEVAPRNVRTGALIELAEAEREASFPAQGVFHDAVDEFGGSQVRSQADQTDIDELEERLGISTVSRRTSIEFGLRIVRNLMHSTVRVRGKNVPRFAVAKRCKAVRNALGGGYYYPEGDQSRGPVKGGTSAAVIDCIRYVAQEVVESGVADDEQGSYPREMSFGSYGG